MKLKLLQLFFCIVVLQQNIFASCTGTLTYTTPSGTFDDGSGPLNYNNLSNCFYLISPGAGFTNITLHFNDFSTESFFDFVYVYDGPTTASPLLGVFDGIVIPPNLTSSGNQMLIRFTSDNTATKPGWSVNYDAHYCSGSTTFNTPTGSFSDGSGTNNYGNNSNCSYLISPGAVYTNITLNFNSFDVENNFDFVKVYDGPTTASPLIASNTGNTLPASINSSGNQMLVVFNSDFSNTAPGWDASYVANVFCGGTTILSAPTGSFSDGSDVNNYAPNSNCSWLISPSGTFSTIALNFSNFVTELNHDFVTVYDGSTNLSPVLGTFSGNSLPSTIHSTGTTMLVVFTTDDDISDEGWNASYVTNCTPQITISGNTTICGNEQPFFNAIVLNGGPTPSYQWKVNNVNAGSNSTSFSPNNLVDGDVVSVELLSNATCAFPISVSHSITFHMSAPVVGINASSTNVCSDDALTLNGTGAISYSWDNGITDGVAFIPPPGLTTYNVTGTDGNGCTATSSIAINVHPSPTPIITSNIGSFAFCYCNNIILNAGTYNSFFWSTGATTQTISVHSASAYTVTVTNSFGCTGSTSVVTTIVTSKPSKPSSISGTINGLCSSVGNIFSISPVPTAISYEWSVSPGTITGGQGTTSITVDFGNFSTATIKVKAKNSCGKSNSRELLVNSKPAKPIAINGMKKGVCKQNGVVYSIDPVQGATYYTWIVPPGVLILSGQGTTSISVKFLNWFSSSGNIGVKARNICGSSSYINLNVQSIPQKPSDINGPAGICQFQSNVNYSITPVFGAVNYTWIVPAHATIVSGQGTPAIVLNFGDCAGEIKVKAKNYCGSGAYRELDLFFICRQASDIIPENKTLVYPNPVNDILNLKIASGQNEKCTIRIMDMVGKQMMYDIYNLSEGNNHSTIEVSGYSKGMYLLIIEREGMLPETIRVVIE